VLVVGMTDDVAARLRPWLSLYREGEAAPAGEMSPVAAALGDAAVSRAASDRPQFMTLARVFRVTAAASLRDGPVSFGPPSSAPDRSARRWRNVSDSELGLMPAGDEAPDVAPDRARCDLAAVRVILSAARRHRTGRTADGIPITVEFLGWAIGCDPLAGHVAEPSYTMRSATDKQRSFEGILKGSDQCAVSPSRPPSCAASATCPIPRSPAPSSAGSSLARAARPRRCRGSYGDQPASLAPTILARALITARSGGCPSAVLEDGSTLTMRARFDGSTLASGLPADSAGGPLAFVTNTTPGNFAYGDPMATTDWTVCETVVPTGHTTATVDGVSLNCQSPIRSGSW